MANPGMEKRRGLGYREMLPCGCYLAIENGEAYVAYDFLSVYHKREMEYRVPVDKIHEHLAYLKKNLEVYLSTKDQIPILMSSAAQGGMYIWYNNEYPGVCVKGDYFAVENWAEYEMYESCFLKAEKLAEKYFEEQSKGGTCNE